MALGDLTTVAAIREYLQKDGADTAQDPVVASLITRASAQITSWCEREFAPATTNETRTYVYGGHGLVDLAPYDVRTVSQIVLDTDTTSPITLDPTQYRLRPKPLVGGYHLLQIYGYGEGTYGERELEITGDWGFETIPADVEHACIITVVTWLRRDVQAFSSTFSLDEGREEIPEALPAQVLGALGRWRRIMV